AERLITTKTQRAQRKTLCPLCLCGETGLDVALVRGRVALGRFRVGADLADGAFELFLRQAAVREDFRSIGWMFVDRGAELAELLGCQRRCRDHRIAGF